MTAVTVFACFSFTASATESAGILELAEKFKDGTGPDSGGIRIDYVSYTPENLKKGVRYPLVILIHGMGQGGSKREQIVNNDFPAFAGKEMQHIIRRATELCARLHRIIQATACAQRKRVAQHKR